MNNPAGMSQGELMTLASMMVPAGGRNRETRRRMSRPHRDDNKPTFKRDKQRAKNRSACRARARNRR